MSERSVDVVAPAKINLVLDLLHERDDGYTEIATVFQALRFGDALRVAIDADVAERTVSLTVASGESPCAERDNLAWRAAQEFVRFAGLSAGVRITLEKRIPPGAGLGGGSSDAAAVLRALRRLAPGALDEAEVHEIAASLGSDVPYFLRGGLAIGRGRGEKLEALPDLPPHPVVLAMPRVGLSTAAVYREARKRLTQREDAPNISRFLKHLRADPGGLPPLANDLFPPANDLCEEVGALKRALGDAGARAEMTGSGSALFGVFSDSGVAERAEAAIRSRWPDAWTKTTEMLPGTLGP